jgi:aminoglycoside phosphotransferase (APT) family kinase protein
VTLPAGWWPDTEADEQLVRDLLTRLPDELSHVRDLPMRFVAEGWDNSVWRVGEGLAARIPRRPLAAPLLVTEARWLDEVAGPVHARGVAVPRVVRLSPPGRHPHPWLLVTWVEGRLVEHRPVADRDGLVTPLAVALSALHRPAPAEAPLNHFRGPDLRDLSPLRPDVLAYARRLLGHDVVEGVLSVLQDAAAAPTWPWARTWCHGDLHPRNLVVTPQGGLGILDLGDLTSGEPAVDLAVLWLALDEQQRSRCLAPLAGATAADGRPLYDEHVGVRARGWAARFVLAVAGNEPAPFESTLRHAVRQLLG